MFCALIWSGLLGLISSAERELVFTDLLGRRRNLAADGAGRMGEGPGAGRNVCLGSFAFVVSDKSLKFPYSSPAFPSFDK